MNTPFLDEIYNQVIFDRDLVYKYFTVFSLFEYALKRAGFCNSGRSDEAQPDWMEFARAIHPHFEPQSCANLAAAVDYMITFPVMKQVVQGNALVFKLRQKPHGMNSTMWLSVLVRGVRNNLFHGGKFRFDKKRDPDLIRNSLIILENWAHLNPKVYEQLRYVR